MNMESLPDEICTPGTQEGKRRKISTPFLVTVGFLSIATMIGIVALLPLVECPVCEGYGHYLGPIQGLQDGLPIREVDNNAPCSECKRKKKISLLRSWTYQPAPKGPAM